jgi:hypothetical protein
MSVPMAKVGQLQTNGAGPVEPEIHASATSQQHLSDARGADAGAELPLVRWSSASVEADAFEDTNLAEFMTARLPPPHSSPAVGPAAAHHDALDNPLHRCKSDVSPDVCPHDPSAIILWSCRTTPVGSNPLCL